MIRKLLVANRGEIAVRIIRAARSLGIRTIAVYSDADADTLHVVEADEAVAIGASEPTASYLRVDALLDAARERGADALHPGYGFLSERPEVAEACAEAGIAFVGPSARAMRLLGGKIEAKRLAQDAGVPVAPGFFEPDASPDELKAAADRIGYPVMLKASAGGGGRGMRIVREPDRFEAERALAAQEALQAFGDGEMMVEKLIERPRHVEVQVLADSHGNAAALFERDCSVQRRHQKLIEESPTLDEPTWDLLRDAALRLVAAAGYENAGTVEFMLDPATGEPYFLEVNARLQVEHPVTELVAGLDLVAWQLRIAAGEELRLGDALMRGCRSALRGHAVELRIVAENPAQGFLPSVGKLLCFAMPSGPGVRVDTGYRAGDEISRYYDSLIAKVIVHAETRADAIALARRALLDTHVLGASTNVGFLLGVLEHAEFVRGPVDTGFLAREFGDWAPTGDVPGELAAIVSAARGPAAPGSNSEKGAPTAWEATDGWRVFSPGREI